MYPHGRTDTVIVIVIEIYKLYIYNHLGAANVEWEKSNPMCNDIDRRVYKTLEDTTS